MDVSLRFFPLSVSAYCVPSCCVLRNVAPLTSRHRKERRRRPHSPAFSERLYLVHSLFLYRFSSPLLPLMSASSVPSIPDHVFVPIFVLMGKQSTLGHRTRLICTPVTCILGGIVVYYVSARKRRRRYTRPESPENGSKRPATPVVEKRVPSNKLLTVKDRMKPRHSSLTLPMQAELRHNIPLSAQPIPASPTCATTAEKNNRPHTARSNASSTFFRRPMKLLSKTTRRTSAYLAHSLDNTPFASRPQTPAADRPIVKPGDPSWAAPRSWEVVPPPLDAEGKAIHIPAVPMPAFLQPTGPVDVMEVDPDTFPLPHSMRLGAKSMRWSASQISTFSGATGLARSSSFGDDSVFCACDLQDIAEEGDFRDREDGRRNSTGSSLHFNAVRCKNCTARARGGSTSPQPVLSAGHPSGQIVPMPGRPVRKPRRVRRLQEQQKSRTVVAGRLYQDSAPATPRVSR